MVGLTNSLGIDLNADACATAEAAGHRRLTASILDLDPDAFPKVRGWVSAPPCQTFTQTGKQSGMNDYQAVLDGLTTLGNIFGGTQDEAAYRQARADVTDPRTALVLETLKFAFRLPRLQWVVAEQVPQVCEIWRNIAAELACAADFRYCDVVTVRADDLGAPTRRIRTFLVACRWWEPDFTDLPLRSRWSCGRFEEPNEHPPTLLTEFPLHSMAGVLGWPAGVSVNTRGARKTAGGNEFSADQPAISLTGNGTRTWYRTDLGSIDGRLGSWQAGLLQGFPEDYPWKGSRSSRFQRCADTVSPLVAAAVIGVAARRRGWKDAVWQRLGQLYGAVRPEHPQLRPCEPVRRRVAADQLDLFSEAS